eukprot:12152069-Alexandrium_andersonii.AAC.1
MAFCLLGHSLAGPWARAAAPRPLFRPPPLGWVFLCWGLGSALGLWLLLFPPPALRRAVRLASAAVARWPQRGLFL